jgi:acyl transferase domain-containing protein/acyl carrier protein
MATPPPADELLQRLLLEKYEPIAVVGAGLRLPGGNDSRRSLAEFLRRGRSGVVPIPPDRWDVAGLAATDDDVRGRVRTSAGGFLTDIDRFDPMFFGISPKEADYVDPQQRLLLETAWEALEDAGLDATALRGGTGGVYVGISSADYMITAGALPYRAIAGQLGTGTAHSAASGRLSYFLGWHGPCVSIDTACSSSGVALHLAVQDLRQRQCDIALCGGVNLVHHPQAHIVCSESNMLAPDGRCKTFDDSADGYSRSEGCGVLVFKRLSDAKRDGDRILALVRGSAIRQDGASGGLTVPNGEAQQRVMRAALTNSGLRPEDIQYVEAHGTGTALGDPIELTAIAEVFAESHSPTSPVLVASGKTNLGHAEAAAGVSAIIKVLAQLDDGLIYPHLNLTTPTTHVAWDEIAVAVPIECLPWRATGPRRALVNSFGFAGTVASVVIEQAPDFTPPSAVPSEVGAPVFTLSARTRTVLRGQVASYQRHLADHPCVDVAELCHATNVQRAHLPARIAEVVGDRADLTALLARHADGTPETQQVHGVAFLFSGQGAQYPGMGATLYRRHRVFRETVDECAALFAPELDGRSISALMFGDCPDPDLVHQTRYTQPALFCVGYALAALWRSWGVRPDVALGHSIGEIVAAAVAGVFSLPDAVRLVATRARLMQSVTTRGGMAAVRAGVDRVRPLLDGHGDLSIAAVNGPEQCVVSGGLAALADVTAELGRLGVHTTPLHVSHAFHSPLMAQAAEEFAAAIADIPCHEPEITLLSNLTGGITRAADLASPAYWARLISAPVDFAGGMASLDGLGRYAMVEIGPGRSLVNAGRRCVDATRHLWLASLGTATATTEPIYATTAALHTAGLPISWSDVHENRPRPMIPLPTYGFDRRRYWLPDIRGEVGPSGAHPLLGAEVSGSEQHRDFVGRVSATEPGYLADHRVGEQVVFPAAGFVEVVLAAMDAVHGGTGLPVTDLRIHEALLLSDQPTTLRTRVTAGHRVEIHSVDTEAGVERLHVTATVGVVGSAVDEPGALAGELAAARAARSPADPSVDELYTGFGSAGMHYGPRFRLIRSFHTHGEHGATAELTGPGGSTAEHLPPAVLDCALQVLATVTQPGLPVRLESFRLHSRPRGDVLRADVRLVASAPADDVDFVGDVVLYDGERIVCELRGLALRRLARTDTAWRRMCYQPTWTARPSAAASATGRRVALLHSGLATDPELHDEAVRTGTTVSFAENLADLPALLADDPTDLCWCWQPTGGTGLAGLREQSEQQYTDLLDLVRILESYGFGRGQRLWLVTRGAQRLPGDDVGDHAGLAASGVWGFGAVLLSEYPTHRVTLLDLPTGPIRGGSLLGELLHAEADEFQIAHRDAGRYTRRLAPVGLTDSAAPQVDAAHTYLVTGGLGGLGRLTAQVLVELGARHLALVSRGTPTDATLTALRAELGDDVTVLMHGADIAEPAQVDALFAELRANHPPLGGVVHAAGVLSDRPVNAQDRESMDTVLRPKVYGGWLLHKATEDLPDVRFFVGFGSSSALLGQAGQANYAAGNAFLDALMHERRALGLPGTAIDWGPWSDVGMAAALGEQHRASFARQGMRFIQPADGRRALAALLAEPFAQLLVGDCDWTAYAATRPVANALYEQLVRSVERTERTVDVELLALLSTSDRRAALADVVRAAVADVLHFAATDDVPPDVTFTNLGLDSLAAVEVKNALEAALRMPLPASITMDYPSTDTLVGYLDTLVAPADAASDGPDWDLTDVDAELAALRNLDA